MDLPPRLEEMPRDSDKHEDEAGEGVGEALVELDAVDGGHAAVGGGLGVCAAPEFGEGKGLDAGVEAPEMSVGGDCFDGDVGGGKGGDIVLVGVGGGGVVLATVEEMQTDGLGVRGVGSAVDDDGLVRGGDVGVADSVRSARKTWCQREAPAAGRDVLNVEDAVFEVLVEDAGLDFEGGLGGLRDSPRAMRPAAARGAR